MTPVKIENGIWGQVDYQFPLAGPMDSITLRTRLSASKKLSLKIRVIPKSPKTEWGGVLDDGTIKVKVAAVPEKGKANDELIRFLAGEAGVARENVIVVAGVASQNKLVRLVM
jgi:uncharacterized protein